jgi:diaminopimelate epimerase
VNGWVADAATNIVALLEVPHNMLGLVRSRRRWRITRDTPATPDIYCVLVEDGSSALYAEFRNPDGTFEKTCANGLRSLALSRPLPVQVRTPHTTVIVSRSSIGARVAFPESAVAVQTVRGSIWVDVGTPHIVRFVENLDAVEISTQALALSTGCRPVNATFASMRDGRLSVRTFERGVGETGSCGTGAIAAVMALDSMTATRSTSRMVTFRRGAALIVRRGEGVVEVDGGCRRLGDVSCYFTTDNGIVSALITSDNRKEHYESH